MLATGVQQTIVSDYYRSCIAKLPEPAQRFIEEKLITEQGSATITPWQTRWQVASSLRSSSQG